jgi:hypothetical protein
VSALAIELLFEHINGSGARECIHAPMPSLVVRDSTRQA